MIPKNAPSGRTVSFKLAGGPAKKRAQKLFIFIESDEGNGAVQAFELDEVIDLTVLERLIADAKEAS